MVGTGPFVDRPRTRPDRVVLERNPAYWRNDPPRSTGRVPRRVPRLGDRGRAPRPAGSTSHGTSCPRTSRRSSAIRGSARARRGAQEEHLLRPLQPRRRRPADSDAAARAVRRRPRPRPRLADARPLRAAGDGIIPPGILGHDPGRRRLPLARGRRRRSCSRPRACRARAPARGGPPDPPGPYGALTAALLRAGPSSASRSTVVTPDMSRVPGLLERPDRVRPPLGRWIADYEDPDNFTFTLFHSAERPPPRVLLLTRDPTRSWKRPGARAGRAPARALYRKFENLLLESALLIPLFHDVDYRVAAPRYAASFSGARLRSSTTPRWARGDGSARGRSGPRGRRSPAGSDRR